MLKRKLPFSLGESHKHAHASPDSGLMSFTPQGVNTSLGPILRSVITQKARKVHFIAKSLSNRIAACSAGVRSRGTARVHLALLQVEFSNRQFRFPCRAKSLIRGVEYGWIRIITVRTEDLYRREKPRAHSLTICPIVRSTSYQVFEI